MKNSPYIRVSRIALFSALCAAGALIKIPGPVGSIALDSFPGYLSELLFGYLDGGIIIGLGHIISALTVGFPLGILHIPIALFMVFVGSVFRFVYQHFPIRDRDINLISAVLIAATLNGLGGFVFLPIFGWQFSIAVTPPLMVASYVNVILASLLYSQVRKLQISKGVLEYHEN